LQTMYSASMTSCKPNILQVCQLANHVFCKHAKLQTTCMLSFTLHSQSVHSEQRKSTEGRTPLKIAEVFKVTLLQNMESLLNNRVQNQPGSTFYFALASYKTYFAFSPGIRNELQIQTKPIVPIT
jgi:hypothetical protein